MIEFNNTAIVITARMSGRSLPGAPMADVNGQPLLLRADIAAENTGLGQVVVAAAENAVAEAGRKAKLDVLVTPLAARSGQAMAAAALAMRDAERRFAHVLVQPCTLPLVDALALRKCLAALDNRDVDGATLAGPEDAEGDARLDANLGSGRELAWVRGFHSGSTGPVHVPIFAWHRRALEKFAGLREAPGQTDVAMALEAGLRLVAVKVDIMPLNVDTPQALEALRRQLRS